LKFPGFTGVWAATLMVINVHWKLGGKEKKGKKKTVK